MKKMSLGKKLIAVTAASAILFVGGVWITQVMAEQKVDIPMEETMEEAVARTQEMFAQIDNMSLNEYYTEYMECSPELVEAFNKKYAVDVDTMKVKELNDEQYEYMNALYYIYKHGEQPILSKNEVDADKKYEFAYALETFTADVAAVSNEIDTEQPIVAICEKYGKDPDGKINDLTPEMIIEIDQAIFQISDHLDGE
ncbi:hypothetical protein [Enterococcus sp. LJL51]|uniref:hypothetical protein n=1 Tax=Enterococcus sp. LJL51 TaxID=3416656 RepID=UPI003CEF1729